MVKGNKKPCFAKIGFSCKHLLNILQRNPWATVKLIFVPQIESMKYIILPVVLIASLSVNAQQKKPATPAKKPAAAPANPMKNLTDSASYVMGVSVGRFYQQQGVSSINATMLAKGINDVLQQKGLTLDDNQMNILMNRYMSIIQESKVKPVIAAGEKFLAANKTKAGVKTTASGLQYEVITMGTGPKPTAADSVTVNYVGTLLDGSEFDNSYKRGEPITFALGGVIRGWTEGLQLMPVGSKFKFYIPHQLGYGTHDQQQIPGGSVLVFEVELLGITGK
jgi:FKBP-type peptidyl-prolyl cis-trans isomerase FklB